MADKRKIGATLAIDGEAEFKKAISEAQKTLSVLGSEAKKVAADFSDNKNSLEALRAQSELYEKQIDAQRQKLVALYGAYDNSKAALDKATEAYEKSKAELGENAEETQKLQKQVESLTNKTADWQIKVNNAEAALTKQQKALDENNDKIKVNEQVIVKLKDKYNDFKERIDEVKEKHQLATKALEKFKDVADKIKAGAAKVAFETMKVSAEAATAAITAAATASVALAKDVVSSYGELEQNIGGSEAVFGDYAKQIQKISEESYKTLGTTQSEYLATANKMGALFQGSGVSAQKSMELTTQAMQRAADMASVMGISTEDALNAVTGAAKGNYTMMDNIGVKMNNTTLEAYAMGEGFSTAWKDMSEAEKAEVAMQYFFENTSQYAGNFQKEATETISGSIALVSSSYESLIAGMGNSNADIVNLSQNLIDAFVAATSNVIPVLENLADSLPEVITTLVDEVVNSGILGDVAEAAGKILNSLTTTLLSAESLNSIIDTGVDVIFTLASTLISSENISKIINAAFHLISELVTTLITPENITKLVDAAFALIDAVSGGLVDNLQLIMDAAFTLITTLITELTKEENLNIVIDAAVELVGALLGGLVSNLPAIAKGVGNLITNIIHELITYDWGSVGSRIWEGIKAAWKGKTVEVDANGKAHAGGLDYVPYDGYTAILHKGEKVSAAGEVASSDRDLAELTQKVDALGAAINNLPTPQVNFYGTGGAIARALKKEITREDKRASAFGGAY